MKEIFKPALTMCGRMVIVTVMNIFVCISLMVLATAAFTEVDGYNAFVYEKDNDTPIAEYTHKNADGEDTKKAEYEAQGYVVSTQETRTDLSKAGMNTYLTVSQLIAVLLMTGFIYPNVWDLGAKDSNLVKFKHKKENKLRGLKIGLLAVAPAVLIMLLIFVFGRKIFNVALFSTKTRVPPASVYLLIVLGLISKTFKISLMISSFTLLSLFNIGFFEDITGYSSGVECICTNGLIVVFCEPKG